MSEDWQIEVEEPENCSVSFSVTIPADEVSKARKEAVNEIKQQVAEPGFRKGKVPASIVEKKYEANVSQRLLEKVVPAACRKVYREHDLKPVAEPIIQDFDLGEVVSFEAEVDVQPEFEVDSEDYTAIPVEKEKSEVSDEDVEEQIENFLKNKTKMLPVEEDRPIRKGDFVRLDMEGISEDGETLPGTVEDDIVMEIGEERYLPEIEQGLIGVSVGGEELIKATFPEDFLDEKLAGEEVTFKVRPKEIEEKKSPDLEDEEILESLDVSSADEFRQKIRQHLEEMNEEKEKQQLSSQIYEHLIENIEFDIPASLLEREVENIIDNQRNQVESQGLEFEQWLDQQERSMEDLKEDIKPDAERRIRLTLIFEAIGRAESVEVSEEEIQEHIEKMAASYGLESEEFKKHFPPQMINSIRQQLRDEKILDYLIDNADIKITEPQEDQE
ncbi:MAG: trigger factor [bacterium]